MTYPHNRPSLPNGQLLVPESPGSSLMATEDSAPQSADWPIERTFVVNGEERRDITTTEEWLTACGVTPPVRLCCGQRHAGVQCPDGLVMCCLCFERFPVEGLSLDPHDGKPWDVCIACDAAEKEAMRARTT